MPRVSQLGRFLDVLPRVTAKFAPPRYMLLAFIWGHSWDGFAASIIFFLDAVLMGAKKFRLKKISLDCGLRERSNCREKNADMVDYRCTLYCYIYI